MDARVVRLKVQPAPNVERDPCVVRLKVYPAPHVVKDETPPEITRGGRSSVSTVAHGPIITPKTTLVGDISVSVYAHGPNRP